MSYQDQTAQIKSRIQTKYGFLQDEEINICYDKAIKDFLLGKYPSDNNRPKPENITMDFFTTQWLYDRMEDILERAGGTSVTAYKENGINFNYGGSYIDPTLLAQLMPKGRVPRGELGKAYGSQGELTT